jgi:hypothetical protein
LKKSNLQLFQQHIIKWISNDMKTRFVRVYLIFTGVILTLTALAKLPSALLFKYTSCMEGDPILGIYQPFEITNESLLGFSACCEFAIVILICFSPWRWLPCLASALWGSACLFARLFLMDPNIDCGCLGWIAMPGPLTNVVASFLALLLAAGGYSAFWFSLPPKAKVIAPLSAS